MPLLALQYSAEVAFTTSTGALLSADFGFNASRVRIDNSGTVPIRATLTSSVASTSDTAIPAGGSLEVRGAPTSKCGLHSTSTSTDGRDLRRARVWAHGG